MAKAEGIPPTASVASVGPGIRYLGSHCYAFSGEIGVDNNVTELLNFTSGNGYIVGEIQNFYVGVSSGSQPAPNVQYQTKLNGLVVTSYATFDAATDSAKHRFIEIIIPPFTNVVLTAINAETTATIQQASTFTGRVYDA